MISRWIGRTLTPQEIEAIKTHKLHSVDMSLLSNYVFKHFNAWFIKYVPTWLAPNVLTLIGYCSMLMSALVTIYLDPKLTSCPRYLPLLNAILLFIYFLMDNIDGVQARRTDSCSPIGHLLDHGVDSCAIVFLAIALASSLRFGFSIRFISLMFALLEGFYFAGLEEKYTGTFILRKISGPSEGIALVFVLHLLSFFLGPAYINEKISIPAPSFIQNMVGKINEGAKLDILTLVFITVLSSNLVTHITHIYKAIPQDLILNFKKSVITFLTLFIPFIVMEFKLQEEHIIFRFMNLFILTQTLSLKYIFEIYGKLSKSSTELSVITHTFYSFAPYIFKNPNLVPLLKHLVSGGFVASTIYYLLITISIAYDICWSLNIHFFKIVCSDKKAE